VIIDSRELLRQPRFPVALLPVVALGSSSINFIISLIVVLLFLLLGGTVPGVSILMLPLVISVQFVLMLSIVYFLAAMNVIFRDTRHILPVVLQLCFFMTPIFYDITSVPERYRPFYLLNPMARLVGAYRTLLMQGNTPEWLPLFTIGMLSLGFMGLSHSFFRRTSYRFVEEL
jgi:lipopolysaccharide transport system permease protein